MSKKERTEIGVMSQILRLLEPFSVEKRERVLAYVAAAAKDLPPPSIREADPRQVELLLGTPENTPGLQGIIPTVKAIKGPPMSFEGD